MARTAAAVNSRFWVTCFIRPFFERKWKLDATITGMLDCSVNACDWYAKAEEQGRNTRGLGGTMRRREQDIPIVTMRTIVAISEAGSLSKAALSMGLSQPAISSQIKRIERAVGGALFSKTPNGSFVTDLGQMVLVQARKTLEAHDQIFSLGRSPGPEIVRLGLSALLVRRFMQSQSMTSLANVHIHSETSAAIERALVNGHIDIACFFDFTRSTQEWQPLVVKQFEDQLVWVRSRGFVLRPGVPIPIVMGSGDDWLIGLLTRAGLAYQIVYYGEDYDAKLSAIEAGMGVLGLPSTLVSPSLIRAKEYYFPPLPLIRISLCVRKGFKSAKADLLQGILVSLFFDKSASA